MSRNELVAYAAGYLDGEGCIIILRKKVGVKLREVYYMLRIQCNNTEPHGIELLYGLFGGAMRKRDRGSAERRYNNGVVYEWEISGNTALATLKELRPYLRQKQAQADLAIQFQNYRNVQKAKFEAARKGKRYGRTALPAEVHARYDKFYRDLQAMHCRKNRYSLRAETNSDPSPIPAGSDSPISGDSVNPESAAETTAPAVH